jgi:hypothetical protein
MESIGVDGCRGGWVLAVRSDQERRVRFYVVQSLASVFRQARAGHAVIAIDMPGFPESEARACDAEVREELGGRRSSVFSVPCRRAARRANKQALACSISEQGLALRKKDARGGRADHTRAAESGARDASELVFTLWNRGPMAHHKSKPKGRQERLNVLARRGISLHPAKERYWLGGRLVRGR